METTKESLPNAVDEMCVDAVHPRIKSITVAKKNKRKDKSRSQSSRPTGRDADDDGCPIIDSSSGSYTSLTTTEDTEDTSLTCSRCGLPTHRATKELITLRNSVVVIKTSNCDGSNTSRFVFPSNSQRKSYLPRRSLEDLSDGEEAKGTTELLSSCCKQ